MSTPPAASDAFELTCRLIERASVTPDDCGCQDLIADILEPCGFTRTDLSAPTGSPPVRNTWLRLGTGAPLLVLAGHTDVVPPGDAHQWRSDPFKPTVSQGWLYGRGASDMKASVAAMTCALRATAARLQATQAANGSSGGARGAGSMVHALDGSSGGAGGANGAGSGTRAGFGAGTADSNMGTGSVEAGGRDNSGVVSAGGGSVALLLTSDEEGPGIDGTRLALERLAEQGVHIDRCLIGEPTSSQRCGDIIKIGRRGSLSARLTVHGRQGHIAYPHLADNPIHALISRLGAVIEPALDEGGGGFEPSSLQLSAIHAGVASNVIPGQVDIDFNIRFNPIYSAQSLRTEIEQRLKHSGLTTDINWRPGHSEPFISRRSDLADCTATVIAEICGQEPARTTGGGTSDGRYISRHCEDLVEFGPINDTIHQANERVGIEEITLLEQIYTAVITRSLGL